MLGYLEEEEFAIVLGVSKKVFDFDMFKAHLLSDEVKRAIIKAPDCNTAYAPYYACMFDNYNDRAIALVIEKLDLKMFPQKYLESIIKRLSKYIDNGGNTPFSYTRYLGWFPEENSENNLKLNLQFMRMEGMDTKWDKVESEVAMENWEHYYIAACDPDKLCLASRYNPIPEFLIAVNELVKPKLDFISKARKMTHNENAALAIHDFVKGKVKLSAGALEFYGRFIDKSSKDYDAIRLLVGKSDASTLNIDFEEVV